jgi:tetratricopeptide (TPR) repeat protein
VRDAADKAVRRGRTGPAEPGPAPKARRGRAPREAGGGTGGAEARAELVAALGAARGGRANERLRDAAHAFERERFEEARTLLRPLAESAPQAPSVRELLGLTYYRLGRWKDAVRELEAFRQLTGSTEQHPVLADSYRALRRHREVEDLWDELKQASPAPDLVTEGRIVMAGSLADRGDLAGAVSLLERSQRPVKRPDVHHLRQGYALADLYERAGDVARARELFRWVALHEPEFADAAERATAVS